MITVVSRLLIFCFLFCSGFCRGQGDSLKFFRNADRLNSSRILMIAGAEGLALTGGIIGLSSVWYNEYNNGSFHFFDDSHEWQQMDKAGHFFTASYLTEKQYGLLKWAGAEQNKSALIGAGSGLAFLSVIEILDGYSAGWGASSTDMIANFSGCLYSGLQLFKFGELKSEIKFSFHRTPYAGIRPAVLGSNYKESIFKDYNGQTYWVNFHLKDFVRSANVPTWLYISLGYGASGMIHGHEQYSFDPVNSAIDFERYRQYYLSFDIDLRKIIRKPGFLRAVCSAFSFIKIPLPTLSYDRLNGFKGYGFYY